MTFIAPIVEGHGEQQAVQRLLRRIANRTRPDAGLHINEPIRVKAGSFLNDAAYFHRYLALAAAKARQRRPGHVLVLLDSEDHCPARLGPDLLARVQAVTAGVGVVVALAYREYETWFMSAAESLRGVEGLDLQACAPEHPEHTRDAKGWLGRLMPHGYDPISHQLAFTHAFDLHAAERVPSFARLCRKIGALVEPEGGEGPQNAQADATRRK